MNFKKIMLLALGLIFGNVFSQNHNNEKDSLYIAEVEERKEPAKVLHAEPLYIDLIRDLGARKGEKEWNLGLGLTDKLNFDAYEALVEYEWAPIDRLGLEVELPFTFYSPTGNERVQAPSSKLNSFKLALQWSFLVNEEKATTMALGYINELEFSDFGRFGRPLIKGNVYNPFFVVAKRWGNNFHTLVYTGPMIEQNFITNKFHMVYDVHSSFHYMISGTRNFVGVEFNKTFDRGNFDMVMRPQMRLGISEQLMLGVVVGIPVSRENERLSSFLRLIWEPKH
ncbi:HAEPLYID family protein [Riemerella anatipestifer]|uniref:Phosphoribosylformylglycinamidine synthase n=1 Tax=Riemerella anatipestifer TaxID=34085 RepID=A0AAP6LLR1_RIEAN|nr:HAEPLYID family protein [Riemerella anatipestifer]MCD5968296.1 phosphoribosylformylglycinamidine synthase [Riemerella anatipestifer]MCO7354177.1 phosphoribosylformylglycinamidine synthase [Riemerella anatipestifer]MCU7540149.1 phosphoribosylformylglycinamidine synthase [Riemerella anatipestifer]MCU7570064.1 phosphoribosylformylglycinamidine synthase [Riemerella anatipestifer]MCU7597445.1 phosphoribosylformylglycinamidine synthase [Riemerella anatipestifer]